MNAMFRYILVILSSTAPSFCYYDNKRDEKFPKLLPLKNLKNIISFANDNNLKINFIYDSKHLPKKHEAEIMSIDHVKIVPYPIKSNFKDAICVIDSDNESIIKQNENILNNIILRLKKINLKELSQIVKHLIRFCQRITLIVLDLDTYSHDDLDEYNNQLSLIREELYSLCISGKSIELNSISDRIFLTKHNNCNAGIEHITYAPDGNFYICPGFYFEGQKNALGNLENGWQIKNNQLLTIEYSPICRMCDAFQCKRCVYLNNKITLEINIPSHEQCYSSHIERLQAKKLLNQLREEKRIESDIITIKDLTYHDPFGALLKNRNREPLKTEIINDNQNKLSQLSDRELLLKILQNQELIIKKIMKG